MASWRKSRHCEITNWEIMKRLMTRHFIPPNIRDKFYLKLQRLKQGDELSVKEYAKKFKLFVIASDVGGSERWQVTKFISGLKHEIAKRLEIDVYFEPSISLKVIIKYALEYEKIVSVFEKILVCKKNESVEVKGNTKECFRVFQSQG